MSPALQTPQLPGRVQNDVKSAKKTGSLQRALQLGALVHRCLQQRQSAAPSGGAGSLRRVLAQLPNAPSLTTAWRALGLYRLSLRHPEILDCAHLGIAHFGILLSVPAQLQLAFIQRAESERWSRRRLDQETAPLRRKRRSV